MPINEELFTTDESHILTLFDTAYKSKITISKQDLFSGYKILQGMTYSCDIGFLAGILPYFDYAEIILGSQRILGNELITLMAVEQSVLEMLKPYITEKKNIVYKMYYEEKLKL